MIRLCQPIGFRVCRSGAALHARAGVVRPQTAIKRMLEGATVILNRRCSDWIAMAMAGSCRARWSRAFAADAVVLACGAALTQFEPASFLPIAISHGQIEWGRLKRRLSMR
jgi:hypothetical protein